MEHNYLLGLYEKSMPKSLDFDEMFRTVKQSGYDYMELSIDETEARLSRLHWTDDRIRSFISAQLRECCPVKSMCLSGHRKYPLGHPDPVMQKKSLDLMELAIQFAVKSGIRIIQLAGYDVYYEAGTPETQKIFAENLSRAVGMAADEGVVLGFETMETSFLNTVKKAMFWVDSEESPWLQIYPDIGNLTNAAVDSGHDLLADIQTGKGHISAAHLKETLPGIFREVPYGTGHVNFSQCISVLLSLGVRMFVAEFWYTGQENWRDILVDNNRFLRKCFETDAKQQK